jgi:DNA-directed RNA polymerase specialized sigma24 family protein
MRGDGHEDEAPAAAGDAAAPPRVAAREVDELLAFLVRRTRDPQLAADIAAETLAAGVLAGAGERPTDGRTGAWLQGLALERLAGAQRRGAVDCSARRRLGLERIELTAADRAHLAALGAHRAAALWAGRPAEADAHPPGASGFASRLTAQLGDAVPRMEPRGGRARPVAAALAAAVVLAGLVAAVASRTDPGTARAAPGPHVVADVALADGLGRTARVAFGSVWLSATNDEAVLRVDPRTRRVTARIRVGTDVNLGAGAGAIWAVPRRPTLAAPRLIRIDPRTNRVVARIRIPSPGARYPLGGAAVLAGRRVWVVGAMGLLAVDPRRNRPVHGVVLGGDFLVVDSLLRGRELWVSRADRSITRFDALTGRRLGRLGWPAPSEGVVPYGDRFVKVARRSVSLVDPADGRTMWRTRLGTQLNDAAIVAGRLLVEGAAGTRSRDLLWELDPRTGRVIGAVTVPGFSVTAVLRVGREAWLATADGHVIVVAP